MLSGWSTHGKISCPYCMENTKTFTLKSGGKPTFFDCHRQFLPLNHPYRKDKDKFFVRRVEKSGPPPRLSGDDLLKRLSKFPPNTFGKPVVAEQKWRGYGKDHNWTKKSIFWELPYWSKNLIRHNLDVMQIEKNAFDNVFNTVMDVKDKTKDNVKSREDLKRYCKRPNLNMFEQGGKLMKPKAPFTLSKSEIRTLCEWIKQLKFPDGYSSNISKCVNLDDCKLYGLKSHDCHVFMERLIPIAFREMLPKGIWDTLTELSHYFRDICSTVMHVQHLHTLEINIVEILCKLEKIFPPSFFDSMEHLAIHLAYEAKVGGPNQYRWMYPFERCMMSLKRKVRNKASIEGSICEAYLIQETSNFCSFYFEPHIQTMLNRVPMNDDGGRVGDDNKLSIFNYPCRSYGATTEVCIPEDEYKAAEIYVLLNCQEIMPFVEEFDDMMLENNPNMKGGELDQLREKEFADWVRQRVCQDTTVDVRIRDMCNGPRKYVTCYNCCFVNGFKFHTKEYGQHKTTINSGVCIKGNCYNEFEKDYYGTLESVIQLHYVGGNRVTLFKCLWYDTERGVKVDSKHGLVDINIKSKLGGNDPFVLAEQAHQVYYTTYPARKRRRTEWWAVSKTKARSTYIISEGLQDDEVAPTIEGFYQEDEMSAPVIVGVDVELDQAISLPTNEVEDVGPAQVSTTSVDDLNVDEDLEDQDEEEEFDDDEFSKEEDQDDFELSSSDSE